MDIVTQTVLGAAVGEFVLGRKVGNKAILWGAVGGLIPDLDIIARPFLSDVDGLFFHRGITHSIIFAFLLAPPLGWLIHKLHRKKENATRRKWSLLVFWAAFTHPLLDYFTTYGTGAFLPFSGYRVEFGSIGIVDVFYTLPIIIALLIIPFLKRNKIFRRKLIFGTVLITSLYVLGTVVNKFHVNSVFKEALAEQKISYERYKTSALPLSNFLWMGMAESDSGYYLALYSNFDSKIPSDFTFIPRNEFKLNALSDNEELKKLIQFTKGFYHINEDENGLYLADLRFGMMGIDEDAEFLFKFYIKEEKDKVLIQQSREARSIDENAFSDFIDRIKGI